MSAKMTGRRTPLQLSTNSTGKMNQKPSATNSTADNNRNKEPSGAQKTETDKSIKDAQQFIKQKTGSPNVEKKFSQSSTESTSSSFLKRSEALSKNTLQEDEKKSQNGVSNGSGNSKKLESSAENKSKQGSDRTKSQMQQQQNLNSPKAHTLLFSEKEKSSKKVEADSEKKQDLNTSVDNEKTSSRNLEGRPSKSNSFGTDVNEGEVKTKNSSNDGKQQAKQTSVHVESKNEDEKINGASTPTHNRRKLQSTPDAKNKVSSSPSTLELQSEIPIENDDVEMMEPLVYTEVDFEPTAVVASTPGKIIKPKSSPPVTQPKMSPSSDFGWNSADYKPSNYSKLTISGRRSIRPTGVDYQQMQGYYRKTKTDLDASCATNTSLNVTVGSEAPTSLSFSFFGHGRKRDYTPANSRSELELMGDNESNPKSPKRARVDVSGFFSAVASPLTKLRARFSKTTIQSSTPVKHQALAEVEKEIVTKSSETSIDNDVQFTSDNDVTVDKEEKPEKEENLNNDSEVLSSKNSKTEEDLDVQTPPKDDCQSDKEEPATSGTQQIPNAESTDDILVTVTPAGEKKKNTCNIM